MLCTGYISPANCLQGLGSGLALPPGPGRDQALAYLRELCRSTQDVGYKPAVLLALLRRANCLSPKRKRLLDSDALSPLLALRSGVGSLHTCVCRLGSQLKR